MRIFTIILMIVAGNAFSQITPGKVWSEFLVNDTVSNFGLTANSFFGSSVAKIGDFDNDGVEDYAAGAEGYNNQGAVWVVLMNSNYTVKNKYLIQSGLSLSAGDYFGSTVTGIGDFDNDGVKDIAVGARGDDSGGNNYGAVYLILLNSNGTRKSHYKIHSGTTGFTTGDFMVNDNFGSSLAYLNDYNYDTYKEIAVGANGYNNSEGSVWILSLTSNGQIQAKNRITSADITNLNDWDAFGSSLAAVDFSSFRKGILAGAPLAETGSGNGTGALYLIELLSDLNVLSYIRYNQDHPVLQSKLSDYDQFGNAVALLGDIDKNGFNDYAAGAYQADDEFEASGSIFILFMGTNNSLVRTQKISNLNGNLVYEKSIFNQFGSALAPLPDLDNNGVPGLVAGIQNFSAGLINRGGLSFINLHGNVTTDSVNEKYIVSAKAWGTVNPFGVETTVTFEYGLSGSYGMVSSSTVLNGNTDQNAGITLTGLSPATTYHYRIKAVNSRGTTYGLDKTFTTQEMDVIYVKHDAAGLNNGTTWTDAFTSLQSALDVAIPGAEIWVAAGTYKPATGTDRTISFSMKNGVAIYGGFNGTETQLSERNWETNLTILSGDIGTPGDNSDNSYNVFYNSGLNSTAILNGFIISNGNADGTGIKSFGSGMHNNGSSPTLSNCNFSGNTAFYGGGMYNNGSSPTLSNCTFSGNSANTAGGGIININSSPSVINCTFSGNSASSGGGIYNENSAPSMTNCTFSGNTANPYGGGMFNAYNSSPSMINCTFSGNSALSGGGIYNYYSSPSIINCIIWNNQNHAGSTSTSASIYNNNGSPDISYSLIANSGGSNSWNTSIGVNGGNNIDLDPQFITPVDPATAPTTGGNLRLQPCSPAINAGSNASVPSGITTDLDGNPRFYNSGTVDMGAYEYQGEKNINPASGGEIAEDQTICEGTSPDAFLSISLPEGHTGTLVYQWQKSTTGASSGFSNIDGANSETYSESATLSQTTWYRRLAKVTCESEWVESNAIEIMVEPTPVSGDFTKNPFIAFVCEGTDVSATITAGTGGNGTDLNKYSTYDGISWSPWINYTSGTSISTVGLTGVEIQTLRQADYCADAVENSVNWGVEPNPVSGNLVKIPNLEYVCEGADVSATITSGSGGNEIDQTEYRIHDGISWSSWINYTSGTVISTTGKSLVEIQTLRQGDYCDDAITSVSWVIEQLPVSGTLTKFPDADYVCEGDDVSAIISQGTGGNGLDQTEYRTHNGTEWSSWANYTSGTNISTTGKTQIEIQTLRQAECYSDATASSVIWTIEQPPISGTLIKSPDVLMVCEGDDVSASITAGNGGIGFDLAEYRTHNATSWSSWMDYTSGAEIPTSGKTQVEIQTYRPSNCYSSATVNKVSWQVEPSPVPGILTKSPEGLRVCEGVEVSATIDAGSGGNGHDILDYHTFDGTEWSEWTTYISGNGITTLGKTEVEIRTGRMSDNCNTSDFSYVSWTVEPSPVSGTLTKTPDVSNICEGENVLAVLTPGSGGNGVDSLAYRTKTGVTTWSAWANYTSGANISTTGKTAVEIQTLRKSDYCSDATAVTVSWIVDPTTVAGSIGGTSSITYGSSTGNLTLTGNTGSIQKWQKRLGTSGGWTDITHTSSTYSETPASAGTWQYRVVVQSGTCDEAFTEPHSITVETKELTIGGSFTANNKIYDDNTTATFDQNNLTLVGVVTADDVSLTGPEIHFADKTVGNHAVTITAASLAGTKSGNYTLSLTGSPETSADINPGPPVKFYVTNTLGGNITSPKLHNIPFDVKVTLVDAYDNPTPNTGGTVTVTLTGSGGATPGDLRLQGFPSDPVTQTMNAGESFFSLTNVLYTGISGVPGFDVKVSASASGTGSANGKTGESNLFSVRDIFFNVLADPASITANGTSTTAITVTLEDHDNHPLANQTITVETDKGTLLDGSTEVSGVGTFVTDANGQVLLDLRSETVTGTATVTAKCPGACPTTATIEFVPGPAAKLAFTTQPSSSTPAGAAFAQQPAVTIQDAFGNTVPTVSGNVTLELSTGTGTLSGATTVAASEGVATFTGLSINIAGTDKVLKATSGVLTPGYTSPAFTITPALPASFAITGQNSLSAGTQSGDFTLTVYDEYNNPTNVTGTTVLTLTTTSTGSTASFTPVQVTLPANSGTATFKYTDNQLTFPGEYTTLTATFSSGDNGLTGETATKQLEVTAGNWLVANTTPAAAGNTEFFPGANPQLDVFQPNATGKSTTTNDVYHFVYQPLTGNGTIIARLSDVQNDGWAGVMMRESNAPNAKTVLFKTRLYNPNVLIGFRNNTGKSMTSMSQVYQQIRWMKIQRNGNTFLVYVSYNGTSWIKSYTVTIAMNATIHAGIFAESSSAARTARSWFDHVELSNTLKMGAEAAQTDIIEPDKDKPEVLVYPNPASDQVTIAYPYTGTPVSLQVLSLSGNLLKSMELISPETQLSVQDLQPGVYILRFEHAGSVVIERLVIK